MRALGTGCTLFRVLGKQQRGTVGAMGIATGIMPAFVKEMKHPKLQSVRIITTGNAAGELTEALMCFGATSCSIENAAENDEETVYGPEGWETGQQQLWSKSRITALFPPGVDIDESLAFAADSLGMKDAPNYDVKEVEDCNWLQQVKDQFQPVKVADNLWVVPEWTTPPETAAINVFLDPGLAFGTGEHPTTRLCLKWLYQVINGGERILDYGTGSGILAIAALKMGACEAVGVDIDPMAISSATSNAVLNKLYPGSLEVIIATVDGEDPVPSGNQSFDVVVANILLNPLLNLSSRITNYAKSGGSVALSGIILAQAQRVTDAYSPMLNNIKLVQEDGWVCLYGTKK